MRGVERIGRYGAPTVAFLIGIAVGVLFRERPAAVVTRPAGPPERLLELERENERLRGEVAQLLGRVGEGDKRIGDLEARLADAKKVVASPPVPSAKPRGRAELPYELASVEEADAIFAEAVGTIDIEGLLSLAAVLLSMGEEGYDKLIALLDQMVTQQREDRRMRWLFRDEMVAGRLVRAAADHSEDLLRFCLYLQSREPDTLPASMAEFRKEFPSEAASVLLGMYDGKDPQIEEGYLSLFRQRLEEGSTRHAKKAIEGMAQLRGDAATDVLINMIEQGPPELLPDVVNALGYQGNPRALPLLRTLQMSVVEPQLAQLLDATVRKLEKR